MENSTVAGNFTIGFGLPEGTPIQNYVYFVMSLVGLILNIIVIATVIVEKLVPSKAARSILIHQCVSDSFSSLLNMGMFFRPMYSPVPLNWVGDLTCKLWYSDYLYWTSVQASINNTVVFAMQCYLSIVRPSVHEKIGVKHVTVAIIGCWVVAFLSQIIFAASFARVGTSCIPSFTNSLAWALISTLMILARFVVPFIVITASYSKLIRVLRQHNKIFHHHPHTRHEHTRDRITRELSITVGLAAIAFIVLHAPNSIMFFLFCISVIKSVFHEWQYYLAVFLVNLNFLMNPLIFSVRMRPFRMFIHRLFSRFRLVYPLEETSNTINTTATHIGPHATTTV